MKVNELQDVEPAGAPQLLDGGDEVRRVETELRLLAAALLPAPEAARRQFDPHASCRRDVHFIRDLQQHVDLAQLLEDDEHLMAELLAHEGEAHELLVLVAIADDEVVCRLGETEDGLELRLASALEADAVRFAELQNYFDDMPLLVTLDRVHRRVAAGIGELCARVVEARRQCLDPRTEDVREAEEHGERD